MSYKNWQNLHLHEANHLYPYTLVVDTIFHEPFSPDEFGEFLEFLSAIFGDALQFHFRDESKLGIPHYYLSNS